MQGNQLALVVGQAVGKTLTGSACGIAQEAFYLKFAEDAARFVRQERGTAEHGAALDHVSCAVLACPGIQGIKSAPVQGLEIGFVKPGVCRQLGYKGLVGLLQQLGFYFVEDFGIVDIQPIDGEIGPRLVDVTLLELIL